MNKKIALVLIVLLLGTALWAADFGSAAVTPGGTYTLEEMLLYALEDEHLALAEYYALMDEYGLSRPYSNIVESEKTHIAYLEELYRAHGISIPVIDAASHTVLPGSPEKAAETGVQAEIKNIAMYEVFLKQDLPADVRDTFIFLKKASENHLRAFQQQLKTAGGSGRKN